MLSIQTTPITRQQFGLLVKAKHQIRQEFKADISIKQNNVVTEIFEYSMRSNNDNLFQLFDEICKAGHQNN